MSRKNKVWEKIPQQINTDCFHYWALGIISFSVSYFLNFLTECKLINEISKMLFKKMSDMSDTIKKYDGH